MSDKLRLGVNIDHVATVRNARGGAHPDPVSAALLAQKAGADGITAHLREDRRHIQDADIYRLKDCLEVPLNFEMGATDEMVSIACDIAPHAACLVPERREEVTTEGGLAVAGQSAHLGPKIMRLRDAGARISLFIEPSAEEINAAADIGADIIELHTGKYCHLTAPDDVGAELRRLEEAAELGHARGLEVHAGHGLRFDNVQPIAGLPHMRELNIGHFLIGSALFMGLDHAIQMMRRLMDEAVS